MGIKKLHIKLLLQSLENSKFSINSGKEKHLANFGESVIMSMRHSVVLCSPNEFIANYYYVVLEMLQQKFTYNDIEIQLKGIQTGGLMIVGQKRFELHHPG